MSELAGTMRAYDFHGVRLGCCSEPRLGEALHARLGRFASVSGEGCDLRFDYRSRGPGEDGVALEPGGPRRPVYDSPIGEVLYEDGVDRLYLTCLGRIRIACDPRGGSTTVSLPPASEEDLWLLSHPLFTLPLIESLKRRGRYSLHAAGVAQDGKSVLLPGASGSGKSTLALGLVREGFDLLGDDMLFLKRGSGGLRALAFPEAIDLTDETLRLFPELASLLDEAKQKGWPKRQLRADERYGSLVAWDTRPVAVVFPRVAGTEHSVLVPMDRGEALLELTPNILLTEPTSSQAHLDAIAALVETAPCYRLATGRDFGEVAVRLRSLIEVG